MYIFIYLCFLISPLEQTICYHFITDNFGGKLLITSRNYFRFLIFAYTVVKYWQIFPLKLFFETFVVILVNSWYIFILMKFLYIINSVRFYHVFARETNITESL